MSHKAWCSWRGGAGPCDCDPRYRHAAPVAADEPGQAVSANPLDQVKVYGEPARLDIPATVSLTAFMGAHLMVLKLPPAAARALAETLMRAAADAERAAP